MTNDISALLERARQSAAAPDGSAPNPEDRQKLLRVAQEFESMLLLQVLRDMRRSGKWGDEDEEQSGLGADTMFDTMDVELASHLSRVQGIGLSKQLLDAFDRMQGTAAGAPLPPGPPAPPSAPMLPRAVAAALQAIPQSGLALDALNAATPQTPVAEADAAPLADAGAPTIPTANRQITSNFGWRRDPFTGQSRFHRGVDLAAAYGQEVQAARDGRVVFSGEQRGYGNTVVVEHADGTKSRYAHLSALLVSPGNAVAGGQPVGRAGHSGRATGTHVHFEVTAADGRPMEPEAWMRGRVRSS